MAEDVVFNLEGADEVEKVLSELPSHLSTKLLQSYNRKVAKMYVVDPIRSSLPYSAQTEKGIKVQPDRQDKTKVMAGIGSESFWLRFVEKGTKERKSKKGASKGRIVGRHRVVPIIENSIDPIIDYTNKNLGEDIAKFLQKRIKKLK